MDMDSGFPKLYLDLKYILTGELDVPQLIEARRAIDVDLQVYELNSWSWVAQNY